MQHTRRDFTATSKSADAQEHAQVTPTADFAQGTFRNPTGKMVVQGTMEVTSWD
jgi:hypothetical protein